MKKKESKRLIKEVKKEIRKDIRQSLSSCLTDSVAKFSQDTEKFHKVIRKSSKKFSKEFSKKLVIDSLTLPNIDLQSKGNHLPDVSTGQTLVKTVSGAGTKTTIKRTIPVEKRTRVKEDFAPTEVS